LIGLEVVVVDNGSTDATPSVVHAFAAQHPDLRLSLLHEPQPGVSRAKNRGAAAAQGTWLIFLDADSRMAADLAEQVVQWGRAGYAAGSIKVIADSSDPIDRAFFGLMEFGKALFTVHAQMFFCERTLHHRLGGFAEDLTLAEDREFLQRAQRAGARLCQVRQSWIATSPRRLHRRRGRINMLTMFVRWTLANWGIGRRWPY
jgi:glycosyltransferase involved in cell wall biosynthesis